MPQKDLAKCEVGSDEFDRALEDRYQAFTQADKVACRSTPVQVYLKGRFASETMNKKLSAQLFQFGYRVLRILVVGTVISVTVFAESIRSRFYFHLPFPMPTILLYTALGFGIYLIMGFAVDMGGTALSLLFSRIPELESSDLTRRGEELVRRAGLRNGFRFRLKKGLETAYSTPRRKVVIDEDLAMINIGQGDAILGHEITHQVSSHGRLKMLRFLVYSIPSFALIFYEGWLPLTVSIPYTLALVMYPMKWAFHWGEYDADEGGAWLAGQENMVGALMTLEAENGDYESFTHPRFSKRIRKIQKEFGQAH